MNPIIFYLLCFVLIYAPLPLGANRIWASSSIAFLVFAIFIGHLYLVYRDRQKLLPPRYALFVLAPLAVTLIWLLIQMIPGLGTVSGRIIAGQSNSTLSFDPSLTHIMFLKTLAFFLFGWLLFSYVNNKKTVYHFCLAIVFCGLFQATYAAWLNLVPDISSLVFNMPQTQRANGSFIYHNQLANYLALCLSIGIGILISQLSQQSSASRFRHKAREFAEMLLSAKVIIRLGLIMMIIGLILTRSRMGNSAFFMSLAATSLFAFFYYHRPPRNLRLLIISFFVLDLILIGSIFGVEKVKQRLVETSLASETRDEVVRDALPMIQQHFIFGSGGGSFYSSFPAFHPEPYSLFYDHAHNDYIQFAVELGVPVTLMLGAMILYCLIQSLLTMRKRKTALYQGVAFGSAMAIVHMLLHSTVDFSLQSPAIAILFIAILCLSLIATNAKAPRGRKK